MGSPSLDISFSFAKWPAIHNVDGSLASTFKEVSSSSKNLRGTTFSPDVDSIALEVNSSTNSAFVSMLSAVAQGEADIDKVYKFRDAILEGATASSFTVVTPAAVMAAATSPFSAIDGGGGGGASGDTFCLLLPGGGGGRFSTPDMGLPGMDGLPALSCLAGVLPRAASCGTQVRGRAAGKVDDKLLNKNANIDFFDDKLFNAVFMFHLKLGSADLYFFNVQYKRKEYIHMLRF